MPKFFQFTVTLTGRGDTVEDAWDDAVVAFTVGEPSSTEELPQPEDTPNGSD